jgi:carboxylesterase
MFAFCNGTAMSTSPLDPFLLPGNDTGCLLLHGIGGSPAELRGLGEHLAGRGYTVLGARLAGHGASPQSYYRSRWADWMASAEAAHDELAARCGRVAVIGFSLGGVLGLQLARRRPIDGLVTMGSRILGGDWRFTWSPLLRHLLAWRDPSLGPLAELRALIARTRSALPLIKAPALVMHGRDDRVIRPENAEAIMAGLASPRKELVWWDDTGHHMLVEGPHRLAIYARIAGFISEMP